MENFASLFEKQAPMVALKEGSIIKAEVVSIDNRYVTLSAGLKSNSLVPISEFKEPNGEVNIKVGDVVDVAIEEVEDGYGETRLSHEKALKLFAWQDLEKALEEKQTLVGYVQDKVKGGLGVTYKGIKLFLPGSLVDVRMTRDLSIFEHKEIEFQVVKVDRRRNNIVISRKAVIMDKNSEGYTNLLEKLNVGDVVKGTVKNIADYGVFVDLGGIDGLLYITDLSWQRVKHPSDILKAGDEIESKILKIDTEKQRVSLGLKQLTEDPWLSIKDKFEVGQIVSGTVSNLTDYGAFVSITDCIEGLVHNSEIDWTNKNINPHKVLKIGDEVKVKILDIAVDKHRISLGIKQTTENPWQKFADNHKIGDKIKTKVCSITDFGIFVSLENNIDGLIHISDISWTASNNEAINEYKKEQEIEAVLLSVDVAKERVALGIKQLSSDSFDMFLNEYKKNKVYKATVKEVSQFEALLELNDFKEIRTILNLRDASTDRVNSLIDMLKAGDEVEGLIVNIDKKSHIAFFSIKAKDLLDEKEAINKAKGEAVSGTTSLGALLQEKIQGDEEEKA